jgi:hypothetical protein
VTTCDDGSERVLPDLGEGVDPFVGGVSPQIPEGSEPGPLTLRADGDVLDGCLRALAAWLGSLESPLAGRLVRFNRLTVHQPATSAEEVPYPVAGIYAEGDGMYASPPMSPMRASKSELDSGDPTRPAWLYEKATYRHDRITVEVWCDDDVSRTAVVKAIENGARPYVSTGGLKLSMAGYHNAVASFNLLGSGRPFDPLAAAANIWPATFRFTVTAPTISVHLIPRARIRSLVDVTETRRGDPP